MLGKMKGLHFLTWACVISGLVVLVASSIWFYRYPNPSEYFPYVGGVIFLWILAGMVEGIKRVIGNQRDLGTNQKEIQRWITEQERLKEINK